MGNKVVYHPDYGVYELSDKAVDWLSEHGSDNTKQFIKDHPDNEMRSTKGYLSDFLRRHDPDLIAVVETLGKDASWNGEELVITEINSDKYYIEEFDGSEMIMTPDEINWIVI